MKPRPVRVAFFVLAHRNLATVLADPAAQAGEYSSAWALAVTADDDDGRLLQAHLAGEAASFLRWAGHF